MVPIAPVINAQSEVVCWGSDHWPPKPSFI